MSVPNSKIPFIVNLSHDRAQYAKNFFCPGVQKSCERDEGHYIINNSELEYSSFTDEGGVLMSDIWLCDWPFCPSSSHLVVELQW